MNFIGTRTNVRSNRKEQYLEWLNPRVKYNVRKANLSAYIDDYILSRCPAVMNGTK